MNRNVVVTLALEQGLTPTCRSTTAGSIHSAQEVGTDGRPETRKVQLKARPMIAKSYGDRDIWMAFPIDADWYLVPHDELVSFAREHTDALASASWGNHLARRCMQ